MNNPMLLITGLVFLLLFSCKMEEEYDQMSHRAFLQSHAFAVGQTTLELHDAKRDRPVKTEVWYPTLDTTKRNVTVEYPFKLPPTSKDAQPVTGKFPLILLSHGTGGNRISQMWLACELVGNGYIVASVNHFGNTNDHKIPENFVRIWERPEDISFLLDYLTRSPKWRPVIDTAKIGMVGFSLGGYTGVALAGAETDYHLIGRFAASEQGKREFTLPELGDISHLITPELMKEGNAKSQGLKDDRITAFVVMAPALGQAFDRPEQFRMVDAPLLIIGAENDERAPVQSNARQYHRLIPNSRYVELPGAVGHYVFMNEAKGGLKREAPLIFQDAGSVRREAVHRKVARMVLGFFDQEW